MNTSNYRISLDIHDATSQVSIPIKKGDNNRQLIISLVDGGQPYTINEYTFARFTATKSDGTRVFNDCLIKNNVIYYTITDQTSSSKGKIDCEIIISSILDGEYKQLTSPRFTIIVYDAVFTEEDLVSEDEADSINKLLTEGNALVEDIKAKLDNGELNGESAYIGTNGNWWVGDEDTGVKASVNIDSMLSTTSTNPVQNKVIAQEIERLDLSYLNKEDAAHFYLAKEDVDTQLNNLSTNPVQNKVVTNELTKIQNFEHPKVSLGNDYPNIIGVSGQSENWSITFPQNTYWMWRDASAYVGENITLQVPTAVDSSILFIFVNGVTSNNYDTIVNSTNFVFKNRYDGIDLTTHRFIGVLKIRVYTSYPFLDMGGVPYRWNGEIVENIELKESLATINGQKITDGGNIEIQGGSVEVDDELLLDSENPVQNKVITEEFNNKVGREDYATTSKGGVVKQGEGLYMGSDGKININITTPSSSQDTLKAQMGNSSRQSVAIYSMPKLVKLALSYPDINTLYSGNLKANWTEEEKALARKTIGATKLYKHTVSYDYTENNETFTNTITFYSTSGNVESYSVVEERNWVYIENIDNIVSIPRYMSDQFVGLMELDLSIGSDDYAFVIKSNSYITISNIQKVVE